MSHECAIQGRKGTTDGPREDAARPRTIAEPGETTVGVGEQLPHFPTLLRTGAPGGDTALFRVFVPSSLPGRREGNQGRPGNPARWPPETRQLTTKTGKPNNVDQDIPQGTVSLSRQL